MDDRHARNDALTDAPHARKIPAEDGKPDQLKDRVVGETTRQEALIDEGIEETFPASDPVSPKHIT